MFYVECSTSPAPSSLQSSHRYALLVQGVGVTPMLFSLDDLKTRFPRAEVTTVIQCNGNRREDFHYLKDGQPAFGPPHWVAGAIGNATWAGARMRDVLGAAGLDVDAISLRKAEPPPGAEHVSLMGADHGAAVVDRLACRASGPVHALRRYRCSVCALQTKSETITAARSRSKRYYKLCSGSCERPNAPYCRSLPFSRQLIRSVTASSRTK
jgi:hypothetical protein